MSHLYTDHAARYDAAFDWDVSGQVIAISGLAGITQGRVLEPMSGSGRLLCACRRTRRWKRICARFDLSAVYAGNGEEFAPLPVSESLNGEHLCWH